MRAQRFSLLWDGCPRWPSLCVGKGNGYGGKRTQGACGGVGQGDAGLARAFRVAAGIYPDQRRMRDRVGQRVALPLHHRRVRWSGVRAAVPGVFGDLGHARHGHGVRRGARIAALGRAGLRQAAAEREVALVLVVGLYRLHDLDDVLHHRVRMDDFVRAADGVGHVQRR